MSYSKPLGTLVATKHLFMTLYTETKSCSNNLTISSVDFPKQTVTLPPVGVRSIAISVNACSLFVCLSVRSHISKPSNQTRNFLYVL